MTKSWLITGGSTGLGLAMGQHALQKGDKAILTTRNAAKARAANPDFEHQGGVWLQLDLSPSADVEGTVAAAVKQHNVDTVVNNAGYALVGGVEDISAAAARDLFEANVIAPMRVISGAVPTMRARGGDNTIVNVGSSVSYSGMSGNAVYGSSKSALRTVTEGLVGELAPFGIRVLLVEPGRFRTALGDNGHFVQPSAPYEDNPVGNVQRMFKAAPPSPGNPAAFAAGVYDIVARTGAAASSEAKSMARWPMGPDAFGMQADTAKAWTENAKVTQTIACSTDFKE